MLECSGWPHRQFIFDCILMQCLAFGQGSYGEAIYMNSLRSKCIGQGISGLVL